MFSNLSTFADNSLIASINRGIIFSYWTALNPLFLFVTIWGNIASTSCAITPIENAVDKINQMGGYNYDWKEGYEAIHSHKGHDLGVIAQEVQSVLPEVVTERETGYLAVDYVKLVPVLIEAIKELSAKIDRLENK